MSEAVQLVEKKDAQEALNILAEAWAYYMPEAMPVKEEAAQKVGYVDYYSEAA